MAERNFSSTLAQDVATVISLSGPIEATLAGALSLLEDYDAKADPGDGEGRLFNARQLIEIAMDKVAQIYRTEDDFSLIHRATKLEEAAAGTN